jgi:hypothetical protein
MQHNQNRRGTITTKKDSEVSKGSDELGKEKLFTPDSYEDSDSSEMDLFEEMMNH